MFTMSFFIQLLITAVLGYVAFNTFFRYHFSMERSTAIFYMAVLVVLFWFEDSENLSAFLITLASIVLVYVIVRTILLIKKNHGYFLFNTFKADYSVVKEDLYRICDEQGIAKKDICYGRKKPFLIVIKNCEYKKIKNLYKEMDKIYTSQKKRFTMYNYWTLVAYLIIVASVWRF